jgi:integrase
MDYQWLQTRSVKVQPESTIVALKESDCVRLPVGRKAGKQKGSIYVQAGSWCLRWRETVIDEKGMRRQQRFRVIRELTAADQRSKNRKTGKLYIPDDVQETVEEIMRRVTQGLRLGVEAQANPTIEYLVEKSYFPERERLVQQQSVKPSTLKGYRDIWNLHLRNRIGQVFIRDFQRVHAFDLWQQIRENNPTLTGRTLQHVRTFLSGVFRWALNRGIYSGENPAIASLPEGLPQGEPTQAYTVAEVVKIIQVLPSPLAQALIAMAYGAGLRKGELSAVRWDDYEPTETGATIRVSQSSWNGEILKPKNDASMDTVKLDSVFAEYVEAYRQFCGNPTTGLMFPGTTVKKPDGTRTQRPINLDSFARWQLRTILHRCAVCKKHPAIHVNEDHKFERDTSLPPFKGWHALRRGNATLLASEKDRETAALMLRHSGSDVTDRHYILTSKQEKRAVAVREQQQREERKADAAGALGAAFRRAVQ